MRLLLIVVLTLVYNTNAYTVKDLLETISFISNVDIPPELEIHPYRKSNTTSITDTFSNFNTDNDLPLEKKFICYVYFSNLCYYIKDVNGVNCLNDTVHNAKCGNVHPLSALYVLETLRSDCNVTLNASHPIYDRAYIDTIAASVFANEPVSCPIDWNTLLTTIAFTGIAIFAIWPYLYMIYERVGSKKVTRSMSLIYEKIIVPAHT